MKHLYALVRIILFVLILSLGTMAALVVDETRGLALADLSGASVQVMATTAQDSTMYAALNGGQQSPGIYRSLDDGATWQLISAGPSSAVKALAIESKGADQPAVLYAGTAGGPLGQTLPLWHSLDGGRTWQPALLSLPGSAEGQVPAITALAVDPQQPAMVYVGTDGQGIYRYDDRADLLGYELIGGLALHDAHVLELAVGPDSRLYALTSQGLFASDGQTWQALSLPEAAASLAVAPNDPQRLYAGGVSTGVYRSTDGGRTWERVDSGMALTPGVALRVTALAVDPHNPQQVVAATAQGLGNQFAPGPVYVSKDGGYSWSKLADAQGLVTQLSLAQGVAYATTDQGLARYGQTVATARAVTLPRLRSLANPSGVQVLILVLTAILAALALVGRTEWLLKRAHASRTM
jgi:photosystem II stability/assembly factor-like uncharacterized protein